MVKGLLEKARAGQRVTLIDKIGTVACLAELDGMCAELSAREVVPSGPTARSGVPAHSVFLSLASTSPVSGSAAPATSPAASVVGGFLRGRAA